MPARLTRSTLIPATLLALVAGLALAQPGTPRPGGGGRGPSVPGAPSIPNLSGVEQPGGPGGGGQGLIDRLMSMDANGDGKLSRAEVPPQFAERNFDRFDTNADGFVDRAELEANASNLRPAGGGGGAGGGRMPMGRAMDSMENSLKALSDSALNASTLEGDLAQVQNLQEGALAAKFHAATINFPADVLTHFDGDSAAARMEYREHLMEVLAKALDLEEAIMEGDAAAARDCLEALEEMEHHGHDEFRRE